jgi:alpha-tubulin suppressor-like RCC1 family protein
VEVACGDGHSLALSSIRDVFVWGKNKDGQLGHDPETYSII